MSGGATAESGGGRRLLGVLLLWMSRARDQHLALHDQHLALHALTAQTHYHGGRRVQTEPRLGSGRLTLHQGGW